MNFVQILTTLAFITILNRGLARGKRSTVTKIAQNIKLIKFNLTHVEVNYKIYHKISEFCDCCHIEMCRLKPDNVTPLFHNFNTYNFIKFELPLINLNEVC